MKSSANIDLGLEKYMFVWNAKEESSLYELVLELAYYELSLEEKYRIARQILTEIITEGLVVLEKFTDGFKNHKIETVLLPEVNKVLNNPFSWYPCNEIYAISLTEVGDNYLVAYYNAGNAGKIDKRFWGN